MADLPTDVRRRLATPLRAVLAEPPLLFRRHHSLPTCTAWHVHGHSLRQVCRSFDEAVARAATSSADYVTIRATVDDVVAARFRVWSELLTLQPFTSFDPATAQALCDQVADAIATLADAIESGVAAHPEPLRPERMPVDATPTRLEALADAFAMDEPPVDPLGEFDPSLVLNHFAYRTTRLYEVVVPHLESLGLPPVHDALAMVRTPGLILSAEDPVLAHLAFFNWVQVRQTAEVRDAGATSEILARIEEHLQRLEPALHQNREWTARQFELGRDADRQTQAQILSDVYRRIVEGHLRQYLWASYCTMRGEWAEPPTLSALRDRMIAEGGWFAAIARNTLLIDVRNGEAHAQLYWDGVGERYMAGRTPVDFTAVRDAVGIADCFTRGCEAASLYLNALTADPLDPVPTHGQKGRLPGWQRARAFFGTNRLRLVETDLNSTRARIVLEELSVPQINPCFQALLTARRVLPGVQVFAVHTADDELPAIEVSAEALDLTAPVWIAALRTLTAMPLSTFLPANHDARSRSESADSAAAAVAFIAVDDLLDAAYRASANHWTANAFKTFGARLHVIESAVKQTLKAVDVVHAQRLIEVGDIAAHLRATSTAAEDGDPGRRGPVIERSTSFRRAQLLWDTWPAAPRLPGIDDGDHDRTDDVVVDAHERDPRWRTL